MSSKVWGEIAYPFPNFNGWVVEIWECISNLIPNFLIYVILLICAGIKLIHVSKWSTGASLIFTDTETVGFYVRAPMIVKKKCFSTPDCKYIELFPHQFGLQNLFKNFPQGAF